MTTNRCDGSLRAGSTDRLERFTPSVRAVHWANAALFMVLFATASALYIGPISTVVGRRTTVKTVHVVAGFLLPVPLLVGYAGPWRAAVRAEVRRLARFQRGDGRWLRSRGVGVPVPGKFNAGQKLNAAFTLGVIGSMLLTGAMLRWPEPFPLRWRTGATFVHDWLAVLAAVVVAGHVLMALRDPESLRAMVRGWVPASWARLHRASWAEAEASAAVDQRDPAYDGDDRP